MNKGITMTADQYDRHNKRMKRLNGEPEFENEDEFQHEAEVKLKAGGFQMRTKKDIKENNTGLWYEHRRKTMAQGQAIIADLFIWDSNRGRYIEIELKNGNTDMSEQQRYLHARGEIVVCRNMQEFINTVKEWITK